jgi:hypothetical protein
MPIFQAAPTALENTFVFFLQIDRAYGAGMAISLVVICLFSEWFFGPYPCVFWEVENEA